MKRHLRITVNGRSYDVLVEIVADTPQPAVNPARTP